MFDVNKFRNTVSRIGDQIRDDMDKWRNRPLQPAVPGDLGERDVLGLWAGLTAGEGAKYAQTITHSR